MRIFVSTLFAFIALVASGQAVAQTEVPNTFQAGQPARAAEVNANFDTLESAVDTNASEISNNSNALTEAQSDISANSAAISASNSSIASNTALISVNEGAIQSNSDAIATVAAAGPVMVKANGQAIGAFLQATNFIGPYMFSSNTFWVLSDTGYIFGVAPYETVSPPVEAGTLTRERVRFDGPNCTGQAYVGTGLLDSRGQFFSGYVFTSEDINNPTPVFYSPVGSTVVENVQQQSATTVDGGCGGGVGTIDFAVAVLPNDPLITGVPNQRVLGGPITLGH